MENFYLKSLARRNVFYRGALPSIAPQCLSSWAASPSLVPQCLSRGSSPSIKERRFAIAEE
jgi:hypothetical protein